MPNVKYLREKKYITQKALYQYIFLFLIVVVVIIIIVICIPNLYIRKGTSTFLFLG